MTAEKFDVYSHVTNQIIAQIEAGTPPWRKPWTGGNGGAHMPLRFNAEEYRGINVLMLWATASANGYTSARWMTYRHDLFRSQRFCMHTGPIACAEADLDVGAGLKSGVGPDCRQEPDVQFRMGLLELRQGRGDDEHGFGNRCTNGHGPGRPVAEQAVGRNRQLLQCLAHRRGRLDWSRVQSD